MDAVVTAGGVVRLRGEDRREFAEALTEADADPCDEVRGVGSGVGDPPVDVEVRAGLGGPEAEADVGGEGGGAVGRRRGKAVGEALTGAYVVDDPLRPTTASEPSASSASRSTPA